MADRSDSGWWSWDDGSPCLSPFRSVIATETTYLLTKYVEPRYHQSPNATFTASACPRSEPRPLPHPIAIAFDMRIDKPPWVSYYSKRDYKTRNAAGALQGPRGRYNRHCAEDGHPLYVLRMVQANARQ